jgi:hypothetical protein
MIKNKTRIKNKKIRKKIKRRTRKTKIWRGGNSPLSESDKQVLEDLIFDIFTERHDIMSLSPKKPFSYYDGINYRFLNDMFRKDERGNSIVTEEMIRKLEQRLENNLVGRGDPALDIKIVFTGRINVYSKIYMDLLCTIFDYTFDFAFNLIIDTSREKNPKEWLFISIAFGDFFINITGEYSEQKYQQYMNWHDSLPYKKLWLEYQAAIS